MNLSDLQQQVAAIRLHPLTETNVDLVSVSAGAVWLDCVDREADRMDDLREDLEASEKAVTQAEAEAEEFERRLLVLEAHMEEMRDREDLSALVFDLRGDMGRIDEKARGWAKAHAEMERELTALRKKKGIHPAFFRHYADIIEALRRSTDPKTRELLATMQQEAAL